MDSSDTREMKFQEARSFFLETSFPALKLLGAVSPEYTTDAHCILLLCMKMKMILQIKREADFFHQNHLQIATCKKYNRLQTKEKVHQERLYQEYKFSKAEGHLKQIEKIYTQQIQSKDVELTSMKGEVTSMKKVLEEYKKKFSDISEKLMERNRQYQKLQGLYDSLRLRNITITNQEGTLEPSMISQSGIFGFPLGNKSKFPLDSTPVQNRGGGDGDFQFRPFFVGSPTAPEPSNTFFSFASPSHELEQQQVSSRAFKVKRI